MPKSPAQFQTLKFKHAKYSTFQRTLNPDVLECLAVFPTIKILIYSGVAKLSGLECLIARGSFAIVNPSVFHAKMHIPNAQLRLSSDYLNIQLSRREVSSKVENILPWRFSNFNVQDCYNGPDYNYDIGIMSYSISDSQIPAYNARSNHGQSVFVIELLDIALQCPKSL